MAKQRKTKNLGLNRSKSRPDIFDYIENVLGIKEKICSRGNSKKAIKYKFDHEGPNPLPIRKFNLLNAHSDKEGNVVIDSKDGLQANCRACERKFRAGRTKKSKEKYSGMTLKEICDNHRKKWGEFKGCSVCDPDKKSVKPEEVPISRGMETGLHNTCKKCSKAYSESVGARWEIYSPDGHTVIKITSKNYCQMCGSKEKLHKDHIWPISKGGTDNQQNIQILCGPCNLKKSATIVGFTSIYDVDDPMICQRYKNNLKTAKKENWDLNKFESDMCKEVKGLISYKKNLNDKQLKAFFQEEKEKNNRKHNLDHAVRKFRKYCGTAILEVNKYIRQNS